MDVDQHWRIIAEQRRAIAHLLTTLTPQELDSPSLCEGWRIRDVAAHVALAPQPPGPLGMLREAARARGSFHRLNHDIAVRHADATPDPAADLSAVADSRRLPSVTNYRNIHYDVIVHAQDIARPLGHTIPVDPTAAAVAAQRVWTMGWPFWAKRRLRGITLVAEDSTWTAGSGPEVRGTTLDLLLLLTGRRSTVTGPGLAHL
ncbi:maleylpyruvate isomerase family mycothiol-dependent enzyme [Nocardia rhizosphaerihabitans]|uniref:maleylpyruvate isomerase family mycothiol-dependent enzyme n=1 Tax=Nocardia rhizosphaerihabitans TaxID=1691570 RepID=UPI00366D2026